MATGFGPVDLGAEVAADEFDRGGFATIYIDGADNGFQGGGGAGGRQFRVGEHAFAEAQELGQLKVVGDTLADATGDDQALYLGEFAFEIMGKTLVKLAADDEAEHGIAEKFQAFVAEHSIIGG